MAAVENSPSEPRSISAPNPNPFTRSSAALKNPNPRLSARSPTGPTPSKSAAWASSAISTPLPNGAPTAASATTSATCSPASPPASSSPLPPPSSPSPPSPPCWRSTTPPCWRFTSNDLTIRSGSDIRADLQNLLEEEDIAVVMSSKHRPRCLIEFISQSFQMLHLEKQKRNTMVGVLIEEPFFMLAMYELCKQHHESIREAMAMENTVHMRLAAKMKGHHSDGHPINGWPNS